MMPRKDTNWESLFDTPPSWAEQDRISFQNNKKKADAIIAAIEEDNGSPLSTAQRQQILRSVETGKDFNIGTKQEQPASPVLPEAAAPTNSRWDNVESDVTSSEPMADDSFLTSLDKKFKATVGVGVQDSASRLTDLVVRGMETPGLFPQVTVGDSKDNLMAEPLKGASAAWRQEADANRGLGQEIRGRYNEQGGLVGNIVAGSIDAAQSPAGALSLIGGPLAAAGIADAYQQSYEQGLQLGLRGPELETWALTQASPELISFIPAGKFIGKIPVLGPMLEKAAAKATARFAGYTSEGLLKKASNPAILGAVKAAATATGEATEEGLTGGLQALASSAFAGQNMSESLAEAGRKTQPQDEEGNFSLEALGTVVKENARAGLMFGALAGPHHISQEFDNREKIRQQQEDDVTSSAMANEAGIRSRNEQDKQNLKELIQKDEANQIQDATKARAREELGTQAIVDTAEDERNLRDAQRLATSMPRPETGGLQRAINEPTAEELAADAKRTAAPVAKETRDLDKARRVFLGAPLAEQPDGLPARPVEDFGAWADREAEITNDRKDRARTALSDQQDVDAAEQQRAVNEANKAKAQAEKAAAAKKLLADAKARTEAAAKKKAGIEKQQATKRRNALADQLVQENPNITAEELAARLDEQAALPIVAKTEEKSLEDRVQGVVNQVQGLMKRRVTDKMNNRIRRMYRSNPNLTAQDIAAKIREEDNAASTQAPKEDVAPTEAELRAKAGLPTTLNMDVESDDGTTTQAPVVTDSSERTPEQQAAFEEKIRAQVRNLVRSGKQSDIDILNLMKQGKLIVTDKASSVGHKPAAGRFTLSDGKMYAYLDHISESTNRDKQDLLSAVVSHEASHVGQFNGRDGRSGMMEFLLGKEGNAKANDLIKKLAAEGHPLAKRALARATSAATRNPHPNTANIELVPYLMTEAKDNPPGRLGKVVRDVKNAAKAATRKYVNKDLDYSIDEILGAADKVAGEIVKTDTNKNSKDNTTAEMIYGEGSKGFNEPENIDRSYTSVDGKRKYVLSDKDSGLKAGAEMLMHDAYNDKTPLKLGDIYDHEVLYKEHPEAKNIPVYVVRGDSLGDGKSASYGQYDPTDGSISIATSVVEGKAADVPAIKDTILHEVQHFVQDQNGRASQFYSRTKKAPSKELIESETKVNNANGKMLVEARNVLDQMRDVMTAASSDQKNVLRRVLFDRTTSDQHKASAIRDYVAENNIKAGKAFDSAISKYEQAREAFNKLIPEHNALALKEKAGPYLANISEREAFRTQYDSNASQEELDRRGNPEDEMRSQDADLNGFDVTKGRIDVPQNNGTVKAMSDSFEATPETTAAPKARLSLGERVRRVIDAGVRTKIQGIKDAEDLDTRILRGLKQDTGTRFPTAEVHKEIKDFLTSAEQGTPEGRAAAIAALRSKYPETANALVEARDRISDMTTDIISAMMNTGRPLSTQERKSIETMIANRDTYLSRAYAAFQPRLGRKWALDRWNDYIDNIDSDLTQISNPKVRQNVEAVRDGLAALRNDLVIPSDDVLEELDTERLTKMADKHDIAVDRLPVDNDDPYPALAKRDAIIEALGQKRAAITPEEIGKRAELAAQELLGVTSGGSAYAKRLAGLAKDPGTLKERERVPLAVRKMLGEIESAPGVVLSTLANQSALKARYQVISDLMRNHQGDLVMSPEDYVKSDKKGWKQVEGGANWGQLDGYYVHPKVFRGLNEAVETYNTWGEAVKMMGQDSTALGRKIIEELLPATTGRLNRWYKLPTVVLNPANWIANGAGSVFTLIGAGNFNPIAVGKGMNTAFDYVKGTAQNTTTPLLNDAYHYVNVEAADVGELQRVLGGKMEQYLNGTLDPSEATNAIMRAAKTANSARERGFRTSVAAYAIMDNWAKIANFYDRVRVLSSMYAAAGDKRSMHDIMTEAGHDTSYTNISPERVHDVFKTVERVGASTFLPYYYEVFRTRYTGYAQAGLDLARANDLKAQGKDEAANIMYAAATKRFVGHTLATVGLPLVGAIRSAPLLAALGIALANDDDDDDRKRRMVSDFNRSQDLIMMGKDDNKMPIYFNLSAKFDPSGPMTDILRALVYNETPKEKAEAMAEVATGMLPKAPSWGRGIVQAITDQTGPESDISKLWPELIENTKGVVSPNTVNRAMNTLDSFMAGAIKARLPGNNASNMTEGNKTVAQAANAMGFRFETLDPIRVMTPRAAASKEQKTENMGVLNRNLMFNPNPTEDDVVQAATSYMASELDRLRNDYKEVQSLRAFKQKDDNIGSFLVQAGYPEKEVGSLVAGQAIPTISLQSVASYADKKGAYGPSSAKASDKERGKRIIGMLLKMEPQLAAMGIALDKKKLPKEYQQ